MQRLVKFTKDFSSRKKGDEMIVNTLLASRLVRQAKVAKYADDLKLEVAPNKVSPNILRAMQERNEKRKAAHKEMLAKTKAKWAAEKKKASQAKSEKK